MCNLYRQVLYVFYFFAFTSYLKHRETYQLFWIIQTSLESTHDEWLEKEIDNERQITEMENQLQKHKSESLHHERDKARLQQQLDDRAKELQEMKTKVSIKLI